MALKRRASALESRAPPAKRARKNTAKKSAVAGAQIPDFYKSDFMKTESMLPAKIPAANLNNPVHELFRRPRFQAGVDYPAIETLARLASKLLVTDAMLALLHTIIAHRDELEHLGTADDQGQPHVGYTKRDCPSVFQDTNGTKRQRIDTALRALALLISFAPKTSIDGGVTRPTRAPRTLQGAFSIHQRRSKIWYGQKMYNELRAAHRAVRRDEIQLIALQFDFAVMLAHEIVHALVTAVEGRLNTEPFLFDAVLSEIGFDAEQRWFGGHLERMFTFVEETNGKHTSTKPLRLHRYRGAGRLSNLAGVYVLMEYPYRGIIRAYRKYDLYLGVRNQETVPDPDLGWRIPVTWIAQFFQQSSWRDVEDAGNEQSTEAPMHIGQYFQTDDGGDMQIFKPPNSPARGYRKMTNSWNISPTKAKRKATKGPKKGTRTRGQDNM